MFNAVNYPLRFLPSLNHPSFRHHTHTHTHTAAGTDLELGRAPEYPGQQKHWSCQRQIPIVTMPAAASEELYGVIWQMTNVQGFPASQNWFKCIISSFPLHRRPRYPQHDIRTPHLTVCVIHEHWYVYVNRKRACGTTDWPQETGY